MPGTLSFGWTVRFIGRRLRSTGGKEFFNGMKIISAEPCKKNCWSRTRKGAQGLLNDSWARPLIRKYFIWHNHFLSWWMKGRVSNGSAFHLCTFQTVIFNSDNCLLLTPCRCTKYLKRSNMSSHLVHQNVLHLFVFNAQIPHRNSRTWMIESLAKHEIFYTLKEAQVLIEEWRLEYNTFRPHSSLKYRPPAPEAWLHWKT